MIQGMLHATAIVFALVFLMVVLVDAFQTIVLPRRPVSRFRLTRLFFMLTWKPFRARATHIRNRKQREQALSIFGPLSVLTLFAFWAFLLLVGFALLSLGLGDVVPIGHIARALLVVQSGLGLAYLGLVIGYMPVLYGTFSHREVTVALLDARAGSPPTAGELLARHSFDGGARNLEVLLAEWERWAAEMLETHISYPVLCFFRSQHDNQSWLSAATTVLDACALIITTMQGANTRQAELTFAMARHALVDLGHVFHLEPVEEQLRNSPPTRLSDDEYARLCEVLQDSGISLCTDIQARERLLAIRRLYEPSACALATQLYIELPRWATPAPDPSRKPDAWKSVAGLRAPGVPQRQSGSHVSAQSAASRLDDDDSHSV